MKLREWKKMLAGAAVLVLAAAASPAEAAVSVDPVPGMTDSFIRGADVSMLPDLEKAGVKFYDMDGTQMDELAIMKKYGVNWIRLRIWNHPSQGGGGGAMNAKKALGVTKRGACARHEGAAGLSLQRHMGRSGASDHADQLEKS